MTKLLAVSVMLLCMTTAFGIECYTCNSTKSIQECVEQQKLQSCHPIQDHCQTLFITFKFGSTETKQFLKQCSSKAVCDLARNITKLCEDFGGTCLKRCCDHDSCNEMDGVKAPVPTPRPIKCYQCFSNKSWDHCDSVREVVSCSDHEQQSCGKVVLTGKRGDQTIKAYGKLCFDTEDCDNCEAEFRDPSITTTNCDLSCCNDDLCNGTEVPMVSAIILLACALAAYFY